MKIGFKTTENNCLDFFTQITGTSSKEQTIRLLKKAWKSSPLITLKLIFHLRNIRHGKGYLNQFIYSMEWLFDKHFETFIKNVHHIPNHGCYKDLLLIMENLLYQEKMEYIEFLRAKIPPNRNACMQGKAYRMKNKVFTYYQKREFISEYLARKKSEILKKAPKRFKIFSDKVVNIFLYAVQADIEKLSLGLPVSGLAAKWLPSPNSHFDTYLNFVSEFTTKMFPMVEKKLKKKNFIVKKLLFR